MKSPEKNDTLFKIIIDWLNKPFPDFRNNRSKIFTAFSFGLFVFVFLTIFQPFGLRSPDNIRYIVFLGYGLITTGSMLLNFFITPLILPKIYNPEKADVKKAIFISFMHIFTISLANWIYDKKVHTGTDVNHNLFEYIGITASIGIFPTLIMIFILESAYYKKNVRLADNMSKNLHQFQNTEDKSIIIRSENNKDIVHVNSRELICINSMGNYCVVFYFSDNNYEKKIIRSTLKKIEDQLENFDTIQRVHKSYIVNFKNIVEVYGNARAYYLKMKSLDFDIPVSRNFPITQISIN